MKSNLWATLIVGKDNKWMIAIKPNKEIYISINQGKTWEFVSIND